MMAKQERKKIAIVNVFFPPQSIGGATRVVADNISVLQKDYADDFELVAFTTDVNYQPPYKMDAYTYNGIRVYKVSAVFQVNMDWQFKDERMGELFDQFLAFEKPDLVHFHCIQRLTGSIVEATKERKIPYLVTVHDAWWISDHQFLVDQKGKVYPEGHVDVRDLVNLPKNITFQQSARRLNYLKNLLNASQNVLAVSNSFTSLYKNNGIPNTITNKNGISSYIKWKPKNTTANEKTANEKTANEKMICAHLGGMSEHKGYLLFQEAIFQTQPSNIDVLVVDHGKEEGYKKKDFWGNVPVTFIGRVSQENIVDLYTHIDVLFAPSIWPESYGLVTREAAACGCWVVASNIGAIGEDVIHKETGLLIEANSITALIEAIEWVVSHKEKCKMLPKEIPIRYSDEQVAELIKYY